MKDSLVFDSNKFVDKKSDVPSKEGDPYWKFRVENFPQSNLSTYQPVDGVEVKLLDGCNRSCIFCVNQDYAGKDWNPIDVARFNQSLEDWIISPIEQEKPAAVYGTGGEPLAAMDLVDAIFRPVHQLGLTTRLVTNGTLLNQRRIDDLIDIGIDGVKVTYNTAHRNRLQALMGGSKDGDETKIVDNIASAKAAGLWVFVRIGLGQHNYDELVDLYRLLRAQGVDVIQIKPWVPSGYAAVNQGELSLSPKGLYEVLTNFVVELYDELQDEGAPELTVSCYPPARDLGLIVKDCANVAKIYCEPGGAAMICNFAPEGLGNWYPENGGLLGCVERRRTHYSQIMDDHGVTSCPARYNWSHPTPAVRPLDGWK